MKKNLISRHIVMAVCVVSSGILLLASPVSAHTVAVHGADDTAADHSDDSISTTSAASAAEDRVKNRADKAEEIKQRLEEKKAQAQAKVAEIKQSASEKTAEVRQKACEARKNAFQKRMENAIAQAERHYSVFDKIATRTQDFVANKNLTVPGYDEYVQKIATAGQSVDSSIAALGQLNTDIDCSQPDAAAAALSAFKDTVSETRDSLKAYRTAIKDLISSVKSVVEDGAASEPTPSVEGQ